MSTAGLSIVVMWYLGGLVVFWYLSVQYRNGASLVRLAPLMLATCLMLVTASSVYYDYVDTPLYRMLSYFWYGLAGWVLYAGYTSVRLRMKK